MNVRRGELVHFPVHFSLRVHMENPEPLVFQRFGVFSMVRAGGVEPPRAYTHCHLKTARLPFRHARRQSISLHLDCEVNKSACRGPLGFAGQSCRIGKGRGNGARTQRNRPGRNLRMCENLAGRMLLGLRISAPTGRNDPFRMVVAERGYKIMAKRTEIYPLINHNPPDMCLSRGCG